MKIAMPLADNKLCMHFGHCEVFRFFKIDEDTKSIIENVDITPPPHEPGLLPKWVGEQGGNIVLAGGMGHKAKTLFTAQGIQVITGVDEIDPEKAVTDYLNGTLTSGPNACDH
ncbi:MAG: NifB/NifX family molybdenum-iron cluster-binding protein [Bacteriovoracaceae bacterium]|nr:NifB/NifX family molybdenum-iron cluster-binding protein [Bacteriovoracaceae bacterium]